MAVRKLPVSNNGALASPCRAPAAAGSKLARPARTTGVTASRPTLSVGTRELADTIDRIKDLREADCRAWCEPT